MSDRFRELVSEPLRELAAYEVPSPQGIRAKLDANESPFGLPDDVAQALAHELARVELHRYPDAACTELRALLARAAGVSPAALAFGNGSDELIALLISAFGQPRDGADRARVLYPVPSFVVYRLAALACGAEPIEVDLQSDFRLDAEALDRALREHRPNLVFLARPNNPTGTVWSREVIETVIADHPDTLVVVDEAYIDYGGDSFIDRFAAHDNLILMRTLSKVGLAGLRIGYLIADPAIVHHIEKVRPPYNLGSINQRAAARLLSNHGELIRGRCEQIKRERATLRGALEALPGVRAYDSEANLILFRVDGAARVWQALVDRGVFVRKFGGPGNLASCLRVTVGTAEENSLFLDALTEVLS